MYGYNSGKGLRRACFHLIDVEAELPPERSGIRNASLHPQVAGARTEEANETDGGNQEFQTHG